MATSTSSIPPKLQIPLTIGLSVVLLAVLAYKSGKFNPKEFFAEPSQVADSEAEKVSIEDMMSLLNNASEWTDTIDSKSKELPVIVRDPFERPGRVGDKGPRTNNTTTNTRPPLTSMSLYLSATLSVGQQNQAIINGQYVREGEVIEGYKIVSIGERQVTLERDGNYQTIHMTGDTL